MHRLAPTALILAVLVLLGAGCSQGERLGDISNPPPSSGGLNSVVEDTSPQLGGDLDLNGNNIDFPTTPNISDVLDEDDMSSDSATALSTQQSIKAYVDDNTGGSTALQGAYESSTSTPATIDLNATRGGIRIADEFAGLGSNLFEIVDQNAEGAITTKYLTVSATGTILNGDFDIGSTTAVSGILDEDTLASDSATDLATQQSIKAYVDTNAGSGDVTASANMTDHALVRGDGGAKGIQDSGITIDDTDNVTGVASLTVDNSGLHIFDTGGDHDLIFATGDDFAADRTLTITMNDAARGLDLGGDLTIAGNFTTSGANPLTLTTTGSTNVTLPTSGTLLANVVEDTSPQLGGDLDLNGNVLTSLATVASSGASPSSNLFQVQNSIDSVRYLTVSSTSTQLSSDLLISADDGGAIGASGTAWSDLFLASGGVINFDSGDITLTHSSNLLTVGGGGLTVDGDLAVNESAHYDAEVDDGNSGTSDTIDWSTGNKHKSTVTGTVTYTFTDPSGPASVTLKLVNGGSDNPSWPAAVKWPAGTEPTWTTSGTDIINCYFDGTDYYCAAVLDLQ